MRFALILGLVMLVLFAGTASAQSPPQSATQEVTANIVANNQVSVSEAPLPPAPASAGDPQVPPDTPEAPSSLLVSGAGGAAEGGLGFMAVATLLIYGQMFLARRVHLARRAI